MPTGQPYTPPALGTTMVVPGAASVARRVSYISPGEYRFAPTAVGTSGLVPKSGNPEVDSVASLAQVINRASDWVDLICFHGPEGMLAASVTTESAWVKIKPAGNVALTCNYKPVLEVTGMALGAMPSQLSTIDANTAADMWVSGKVIYLPWVWSTGITASFPRPASPGGGVFAVWTYVNGYPHAALAHNVAANDTSLQLTPAVGAALTGIYAGTQLTIIDGAWTETVTVQATPTSNTITTSAAVYAHTMPELPDFIPVTGLPRAVAQATISLTGVLIKMRGARAFVLSGAAPGQPTRQAMAQAGAVGDYEIACHLLQPFTTVTLHS